MGAQPNQKSVERVIPLRVDLATKRSELNEREGRFEKGLFGEAMSERKPAKSFFSTLCSHQSNFRGITLSFRMSSLP